MATLANSGPAVTNPLALVGRRIMDARNDRGMTRDELAGKLHMTHLALGAIERGNLPPGPETKRRLAEMFPGVITPEIETLLQSHESERAETERNTYLPSTFGDYLKRSRESAGLSQEELAEKIEVRPKTIARWEDGRGDPHWNTVERLDLLFGGSFITPEMWEALHELLPAKPPQGFAERLRYFRIMRGLTQERFAKLLDSHVTSLAHWERGQNLPRRSLYDRIVEVLGQDFVTPNIAKIYANRVDAAPGKTRAGRPLPPLPAVVPQARGPRLKYYRIAAGLSADRLGEAVGVTRTEVVAWERGSRAPDPSIEDAVTAAIGPLWKAQPRGG